MYQNIEKLDSIGFFNIKPGLERISKVLHFLNNPQDDIKYVLIAGTNGKGSVASIFSNILTSNGHKTGLYTSPHLISVTERIKINNNDISEEKFDETLGVVFDACGKTDTELSYFEIVTASAFIYFAQEGIDIGVLEVGMGGRWDATNVVTPLVSVITNISFDHMEHLGETTEKIAKEKAEIIKPKIPVVCGVSGNDLNVFVDKAGVTKSELYLIDRDFNYKKNDEGTFNYSGLENILNDLTTNLAGTHQIVNAVLSLAVCEILQMNYKLCIDFSSINEPLNTVQKKGRFEIVGVNPTVVLDGAHNVGSAEALVNTLEDFCSNQKFVFILSMLGDKDHEGFISVISKKARKIIISKIPNERGSDTNRLFNIARKFVGDVVVIEDYKEAFEYVKTLNKPVCVTGSIYLIGLVKEYLAN